MGPALFASLALLAATPAALATACEGKDGWNVPAPPALIHGRTFYVGTCGLTSLLITSPQGHILIDGGTPQAAPLIAALAPITPPASSGLGGVVVFVHIPVDYTIDTPQKCPLCRMVSAF